MKVAHSIKITDCDQRGKKYPLALDLLDDEGSVMSSIPIRELAMALAGYFKVLDEDVFHCAHCDGTGVKDAYEIGDGNGGACPHCDG